MIEWIVGLCTVVALAVALFSVWTSRAAHHAADEAHAAAMRAHEALAELRRPEAPVHQPHAVGSGPFALEPGSGVVWRVRNTTAREVAIERLHNAAEFVRKPFEALPVVVPANGAVDVTLVSVWGHPLPSAIELVVSGGALARVPIPSDAG